MSRIRTIKPEAFTDEKLWDAEQETGFPVFRAFSGLWCQADKEGRFEWRPRPLKAAILPYWDGDFSRVLDALVTRGFLVRYTVAGREYGAVVNFRKHQFINGKEPESILPPQPLSPVIPDSSRVVDALTTGDERVPHAPTPSPSLPIPDPFPSVPEGEAGEPEGKETICPLDLTERSERAGIPEQFAKAYGAPIETVREQVRETLAYWTIGGGTGRRRKNWLRVLRTRLHELGKSGDLARPKGQRSGPESRADAQTRALLERREMHRRQEQQEGNP